MEGEKGGEVDEGRDERKVLDRRGGHYEEEWEEENERKEGKRKQGDVGVRRGEEDRKTRG